MYLPFHFRL
jgi:propionyl-CoA synthetase